MRNLRESLLGMSCLLAMLGSPLLAAESATPPAHQPAAVAAQWTPCGWGGGGLYWSAVFHPTKDGVIYMGGDVAGVYKSEDHGQTWRFVNDGLVDYGVYSLAVDRNHPETVYAATEGGTCKSTDGGEHWKFLPGTGKNDLRLTAERGRSVRSIAVDPADGNILYAASPAGRVYKSTDAGQSWKLVYQPQATTESPDMLRVQFGKVNDAFFGGFWLPLVFPAGVKAQDAVGFGFTIQGNGTAPRETYLTLKTTSGATYRSRNLSDLFKSDQVQQVVLTGSDFIVEPMWAKKNPDQAKALSASLDWSTVNRMDWSCVGSLPTEASVARFGKLSFAFSSTTDGQKAAPDQPILVTIKDFADGKKPGTYGNVRTGAPAAGSIRSVAVAQQDPALVLASTADHGVVMSSDAGQTWRELPTPKSASHAMAAPSDASIMYGAFGVEGIWKSTDKGQTWSNVSPKMAKGFSALEVAVDPKNPQQVYAIGSAGWGGHVCISSNGGESWNDVSGMTLDHDANPTLPGGATPAKTGGLSRLTNLAINPNNPQELFVSANWSPCISQDGGRTWTERDRGADISCIHDIRFAGGSVYVSVMDEGTLTSADNGEHWKQLWPLHHIPELSGHSWRIAVNGSRIITTSSPWEPQYPNHVVISDDGGKTFAIIKEGLPNYVPAANTMWGRGYARALAVDPNDPNIVYLGIDGDPSDSNHGGGLFKSQDGGHYWRQIPHQPNSRRMFYGLAVDPTDSKRLYWGATGNGGGLYRSDDGGDSWQLVFTADTWVFNVLVTADGTVYCPGKNLWRSTDHGKSWNQLTHFSANRTVIGLETDPRDPHTVWISAVTWDGSSNGAVYKTSDDGATWQDITGNLPYRKPLILRFNPATNELWAGGVGLFRIKQ